ncbi:hypothetical protein Mterra_03403 [Calidithermus terrae]|uniref:Tetratricopeptide repeat protein n=1 Tax=Calidithermus terrae TaxID=1408545 RepID=A0A399EB99_9DEIN|nr:hypothetical protein [Calidithermus terrae]RIH81086.1 hypothetical protein Mterra_03403 [Calidithermus terrae]
MPTEREDQGPAAIARLLEGIPALLEQGHVKEAEEALEAAYRHYTTLSRSLVAAADADSLANLLELAQPPPPQLALLADLLEAESFLRLRQGDEERALHCAHKALRLYLEAALHDPELLEPVAQPVAYLAEFLQDESLSDLGVRPSKATARRLREYRERFGG